MTRDELISLIHENESAYGDVDQILSWIRPTVFVSRRERKNQDIAVAASKAGGTPDVPRDFVWPQTSDGRALKFVAQVNCRQLPRELGWPSKGLIQFFADDWYSNSAHQVCHQHEGTELRRSQASSDQEEMPSEVMGFSVAYMLPESQFAVGRKLDRKSEFQYDSFVDDVYEQLDLISYDRLGGYPAFTQSNIMWDTLQSLAGKLGFSIRNHAALMNNTKATTRDSFVELYGSVVLLLQIQWIEGSFVFAGSISSDGQIKFEDSHFCYDHS